MKQVNVLHSTCSSSVFPDALSRHPRGNTGWRYQGAVNTLKLVHQHHTHCPARTAAQAVADYNRHAVFSLAVSKIQKLTAVDPWCVQVRRSDFQCPFPAPPQHPAHEALSSGLQLWIASLARAISPESAPNANQAYVDSYINTHVELLCSLSYPPSTPQERLLLITKLVVFITNADDVDDGPTALDSDAYQRHAFMHSIFQGEYSSPKENDEENAKDSVGRWLQILRVLWREIMQSSMPRRIQARFASSYRKAMDASETQEAFRRAGRLPIHLDEYMSIKRPASLLMPCFVLLEYALGIELHDITLAHPLMRQLHQAVIDYCGIVNDLVSCRVEMSKGDFYSLPCFLFYNNEDPAYTFLDAFKEGLALLRKTETVCVMLAAELEESTDLLNQQTEARAYVQALCAWTAGFTEWTVGTPRYTQRAIDDISRSYL